MIDKPVIAAILSVWIITFLDTLLANQKYIELGIQLIIGILTITYLILKNYKTWKKP